MVTRLLRFVALASLQKAYVVAIKGTRRLQQRNGFAHITAAHLSQCVQHIAARLYIKTIILQYIFNNIVKKNIMPFD